MKECELGPLKQEFHALDIAVHRLVQERFWVSGP